MNGKGYKAILILVVGLTAFSSAVKEVNQIREFSAQASQFVAEWSAKLTPVEVSPAAVPPVVVAMHERCGSKQSEPSVELPWLEHVADTEETMDNEAIEVTPTVAKQSTTRAKRERRGNVDPAQLVVKILSDQVGEPEMPALPAVSEFPVPAATYKFKGRRHDFNFKINPRDREMLKTLNRSIILRIAS